MAHEQRVGLFYTWLAMTGYAVLPVLVKQIQALGMLPLDIAIWRFVFAVPSFWLVIYARRMPTPARPLPRLHLLGLGVLLAGAAITAFFGLERVPASTYIFLFYTYPAMVALLSLLFGERLPLQGWVALALTLTGIALTAPDFAAGLASESLPGVVLALLNALLVAVYFIFNSRVLRGHTALAQGSAWAITGALLVMLAIMPFNGLALPAQPETWGLLLLLALFCTVMPVFALTIGIQKLGASRSAIISTVEPIMTLVLAAAILGERMQPVQLVGGALIIASVVLLQMRPVHRRQASALVSGD